MSERPLSSIGTELYQIAFGSLSLAALVFTLLMFVTPDSFEEGGARTDRWFWLAATVAWTSQSYWCFLPLKSVSLRSNVLLVWSRGKQVEIALSNVERISTGLFLLSGPVWLHFRRPTELGSKIAFLPAWRWQPPGSVEHPTIGELRRQVRAATSASLSGAHPASVAPPL
jgi:hypothetical protein